ncbi:MAG TPA: ATP-dependent DNA helicase RecQ [Phycisphaerae bacterium]|nr:ATP-dependent DNA helicase RecQ [Phycisphaerae bacterium]HOB76397.1 ATP-dependent DNA helicase RecQ [Phycisphaerae bacterium]HOJ56532.1 ATP-dependent DNA helicase RecQ [Phycisphaerae bacterium]HOL28339.1 ATP-dependent DNA helicase RecQ [Phycisphaerae bacterium]HPP22652.1 ATP-dependent DNA helicase RecQ [Phycisphaerae bacterium]
MESLESLLAIIEKYWGYKSLRPLQREAMEASLAGRDSLAVLPTGGGKSLCYQAPAVLSGRLTVVVSPLIALMKDQVDRLLSRGISAAFLNSTLDPADRRRVINGISRNEYRLIFVAPERFDEWFYHFLQNVDVRSFAIDEAHCISHWGHDFRADYRQLGELKRRFPQVSVHAFTATATPRVRDDIIAQLGLVEPAVLVGDFFRPNLTYRVLRRRGEFQDVIEAVRRRPGKAGIVYCIRRADVDDLTSLLVSAGVRAVGYHAGMGDIERTEAQDAFAARKIDVVVATVAFGMGIDRADIRYVIHAAMPKSLEHYQQETGRAGRDGQPAECILYYSGADYKLWESIIGGNDPVDAQEQLRLLSEMYRYCTTIGCRHRRLVSYFGQKWERDSCGACDVCLGEHETLSDSTITAQKIMSCVLRTGERYGAAHVIDVLLGEETEQVIERGHRDLSTFGLLADQTKPVLRAWIDQLIEQGCMRRDGEYRVLKVTPKGWRVLRSQEEAVLYDVSAQFARKRRTRRKSESSARSKRSSLPPLEKASSLLDRPRTTRKSQVPEPLDGRALALFDVLKNLRRELAEEFNVPAFMVFSDRTLREMARSRPHTREEMMKVPGVGPAKFEGYGERFLQVIRESGM